MYGIDGQSQLLHPVSLLHLRLGEEDIRPLRSGNLFNRNRFRNSRKRRRRGREKRRRGEERGEMEEKRREMVKPLSAEKEIQKESTKEYNRYRY